MGQHNISRIIQKDAIPDIDPALGKRVELKLSTMTKRLRIGQSNGYSIRLIRQALGSLDKLGLRGHSGILIDSLVTLQGVEGLLDEGVEHKEVEWIIRSLLVRLHGVLLPSGKH
jgi:hypothetical protein